MCRTVGTEGTRGDEDGVVTDPYPPEDLVVVVERITVPVLPPLRTWIIEFRPSVRLNPVPICQ